MSWATHHNQGMRLADEAHEALKNGDDDRAQKLFAEAAKLEEQALSQLGPNQSRTLGITAVSSASLWLKSKNYQRTEQLLYHLLSIPNLPEFAKRELRTILQTVWHQQIQCDTDLKFAPGQVHVSVKGGQVVTGGAPADAILNRIQTIESYFYRTAEFYDKQPLRKSGQPSKRIQDMCRPWLFQSLPGSFQFIVAIQEVEQHSLFTGDIIDARSLTEKFLSIVRASTEDPEHELQEIVPDPGYRNTFLKLSRNLAPTGKVFSSMEIRSVDDPKPVFLSQETRASITKTIRAQQANQLSEQGELQDTTVLEGVLRALNLDKDWLEVTVAGKNTRVHGLSDAMDDVIGPMVNHTVRVKVFVRKTKYMFIDIESDE